MENTTIIFFIILLIIIYLCDKNKVFDKNCIITKVYFYKNVLSQDDYKKVFEECNRLKPNLELQYSDDTVRNVIKVKNNNSPLNDIFYSDKFINYLYKKLGFKLKPSQNLPIEFRTYEIGGKMAWHRDYVDKVVNNCPQIEVVFTLENNSDSKTVWIDDDTGIQHDVITENNSIIITQGNSSYHMVTPVTSGQRSIVKIAYDIL